MSERALSPPLYSPGFLPSLTFLTFLGLFPFYTRKEPLLTLLRTLLNPDPGAI